MSKVHDSKVLKVLADGDPDFGHYSFRAIQRRTGLKRSEIGRACRSLTRKGLAKFGSGLFTEDGEVAGSGYAATDAGREKAAL